MSNKINMIGQKFGKLTVLEECKERNRHGKIVYKCLCGCGNIVNIIGLHLRNGNTRSCGCLRALNIKAGQKFGRLTVIKEVKDQKLGKAYKCVCDCGNLATVIGSNLVSGNTRSCGCLHNEGNNKKHKLSYTKLYRVYYGMKARCYDEHHQYYAHYGGRGIKICQEWLDNNKTFFDWAMENGYQENLTIDRIDADGDYEPNNCRWVSILEQVRNRRNSVYIEYKGARKTMAQWSEELNISYHTLYTRYTKKWKSEDILFGKGGRANG